MNDADWANDIAERERQALIARHKRREAPPKPAEKPTPTRIGRLMDEHPENSSR